MANDLILQPCTRNEILSSLVPEINSLESLTSLEFESLESFSIFVLRRCVPQGHMIPKDRLDFNCYNQTTRRIFTQALAATMQYINRNPIIYGYGSVGYIGSAVGGVSLNGMDPRYVDQKIYDLPPTAEMYLYALGWLAPNTTNGKLSPNDKQYANTEVPDDPLSARKIYDNTKDTASVTRELDVLDGNKVKFYSSTNAVSWGQITGDIENQTDLINKFSTYALISTLALYDTINDVDAKLTTVVKLTDVKTPITETNKVVTQSDVASAGDIIQLKFEEDGAHQPMLDNNLSTGWFSQSTLKGSFTFYINNHSIPSTTLYLGFLSTVTGPIRTLDLTKIIYVNFIGNDLSSFGTIQFTFESGPMSTGVKITLVPPSTATGRYTGPITIPLFFTALPTEEQT